MSVFVVDASVAAKWFLDEEHCGPARKLLDPDNRLCAPDFFLLEMDAVFCKRMRRGDVSRGEAEDARMLLRQLPVKYHPFGTLLNRAFEVAGETGQTPYDCLYVVLAELLGARMVTADRQLSRGLADTPFAKHVLWVEDVEQAQPRG